MDTNDRLKMMLEATPEKLAAIDAVLTSAVAKPEKPSLRLHPMGEAAALLGISRCTLWRAIRDGRLRTVELRVGRKRIPNAELRRFARGEM